jgi:NAD(P)-dependent dehydrogenase (short-subunit alcohol dehydrogenase family)
MERAQSRVALVTGARTGIGLACAIALAGDGYRVYGTTRNADACPEDPRFTLLSMNVDDSASVEAGVQRILKEQQRLDVVINNAGWGYGGSIEDTTIDEAKALFETNFFGLMRVCQAALPPMRLQRRGLIVNVSSIGGLMGVPFQGLYSATKFAVEGMTEALRMEVKRFGVDVVLLEPGDIRTTFTENRRHTVASQSSELYKEQYARTLAKIESDERGGASPELVGRAVLRIANRKRRSVRYVVGPFYEKLAIVAKVLLPGTLFERVIMANYGL